MDLTFQLGNEITIVRILGHNITFSNSATNFLTFVPIDFMMLSKAGILKEYPDLVNTPDTELRSEAIKRFKAYIKTFKNDNDIKEYVIRELSKYGWVIKKIRMEGFRDVKIKED